MSLITASLVVFSQLRREGIAQLKPDMVLKMVTK
jgi:hypothetical protein